MTLTCSHSRLPAFICRCFKSLCDTLKVDRIESIQGSRHANTVELATGTNGSTCTYFFPLFWSTEYTWVGSAQESINQTSRILSLCSPGLPAGLVLCLCFVFHIHALTHCTPLPGALHTEQTHSNWHVFHSWMKELCTCGLPPVNDSFLLRSQSITHKGRRLYTSIIVLLLERCYIMCKCNQMGKILVLIHFNKHPRTLRSNYSTSSCLHLFMVT